MKTIHSKEYRLLIDRLKKARIDAGLTQIELARRLATDQAYVSKLERRQRRIDLIELRSICRVIGVDFIEFVKSFEADLKRNEG